MVRLFHPEEMLAVLEELRANGPVGAGMGICQNASSLYQAHYGVIVPIEAMQELMTKWPDYSGNPRFPVPSPHGGSAQHAYMNTLDVDMWNPDVPYGHLRWQLLEWLIERLKVETNPTQT